MLPIGKKQNIKRKIRKGEGEKEKSKGKT